jgi:hypothetical protein
MAQLKSNFEDAMVDGDLEAAAQLVTRTTEKLAWYADRGETS